MNNDINPNQKLSSTSTDNILSDVLGKAINLTPAFDPSDEELYVTQCDKGDKDGIMLRDRHTNDPDTFDGHYLTYFDIEGNGYDEKTHKRYDALINKDDYEAQKCAVTIIHDKAVDKAANDAELVNIAEKAFTTIPDEEWRVPGSFTERYTEAIRPNIKNGTYAQTMHLAAIVASFTRQSWRIDARVKGLRNVSPCLFNLVLGLPNHGKTPINDSLAPFNSVIAEIDGLRKKSTRELFKLNVADHKDNNSLYTFEQFYKGGNADVQFSNFTNTMYFKMIGIQGEIAKLTRMPQYEQFKVDLPDRTSLFMSSEGGDVLQRIYTKTALSEGMHLSMTATFSGDRMDLARSTNDDKITITHPRCSIFLYAQPHFYTGLLRSEAPKDGYANDTGLGYRFSPITIFNTDAKQETIKMELDDSPSLAALVNIGVAQIRQRFTNFASLFANSEAVMISFTDDARQALVDGLNELFEETKDYCKTGWASNATTKMQSIAVKAAWDLQMLELFNDPILDNVTDHMHLSTTIEPIIGVNAVRLAIEHTRRSFYANLHHAKSIERVAQIEEKTKNAMISPTIAKSIVLSRFEDPDLMDDWIAKYPGKTADAIWKNSIDKKHRPALAEQGINPILGRKIIQQSIDRVFPNK